MVISRCANRLELNLELISRRRNRDRGKVTYPTRDVLLGLAHRLAVYPIGARGLCAGQRMALGTTHAIVGSWAELRTYAENRC